MQDSASEDIYTMVGTAKVDPFAKRIRNKIIARAPWLFTTFIGGLISAWILGSYQTTLIDFTAVIFFIPFVIGLAGNVGIQGATVIVRGLATGDIQKNNLAMVVKSELSVGALNGLIFGLLCGSLVYAFLPLYPLTKLFNSLASRRHASQLTGNIRRLLIICICICTYYCTSGSL